MNARHLALLEDFRMILVEGTRPLPGVPFIVLSDDDYDMIARRLVHLVVLHQLLPEISASEPSNANGASVPTTKRATS